MKSIAHTTTTLAFAGVLALTSPVSAEEMQVSGTLVGVEVESHFIPDAGDPTRGFGVEKFVGPVARVCWARCWKPTSTHFKWT